MSKNTISKFVYELVVTFSKYDSLSKCHYLSIDNVPDFLLHELSSLIMRDDNDNACEATGMDNPSYKKTMLPSLLRFMSDSTNKDERIEFVHSWIDGITNYFSNRMQQLINEQLDIYDSKFRKAS